MKVEKVGEYSLEVRFLDNSIEIYDLITDKIINKKQTPKKIKKLEKIEYNYFLLNDRYSVRIGLFDEKHKIATGGQYILGFWTDSDDHGYYFGLYEIGEFSLLNNEFLKIEKVFKFQYCNKGVFVSPGYLYFGLRESETLYGPHLYYLAKLDWNKLEIKMKKALASPVMAIHTDMDKLIIGLKNGKLQIWDLVKDECENQLKIFESSVSELEVLNKEIILASYSGEVKMIDLNGNLKWSIKLSDRRISGLLIKENTIAILDENGHFFEIDNSSGKLIKSKDWNKRLTYSNLIFFRNWYISAGIGISSHLSENFKYSYSGGTYKIEDTLIRRLSGHSLGFFSGDDDGYVRYWKVGNITITDLKELEKTLKLEPYSLRKKIKEKKTYI